MKILITGGAGEVGRYLARDLTQHGHQVDILDRIARPPEMEDHFPGTYLQGDISDAGVVNQVVQGKDIILHLAWSFADDPQTIFGQDIKGHLYLLETASSLGVKHFIYMSTATVYGHSIYHPVAETHPCLIGEARKPLYALGKYIAEELCLIYFKERGLPVTIFRFWWAFGENIGGRHLRDLIKKSLNHQPLEMVHGAGGTFVTMGDLSRAVELVITSSTGSGQIYNVGSLFLTWEEIVGMIVNLTFSNSPVQFVSSDQWKGPAFLNEVWDLSWEKAKDGLGYTPQYSPEGIRSLFVKALQICIEQVLKEKK